MLGESKTRSGVRVSPGGPQDLALVCALLGELSNCYVVWVLTALAELNVPEDTPKTYKVTALACLVRP